MASLLIEIALILLLILLNGLFAMAEISIVSSRKARLRSLAGAGDKSAEAALDLAESPNRFLATVQVGITLVGVFTGAVGGARISERLAFYLKEFPYIGPWASQIALIFVVLSITYISLILGELLPKRLGLLNPEKVAILIARPMRRLSKMTGFLVSLLSLSTDFLFKILGLPTKANEEVSDEEVKALMQEGLRSGSFVPQESRMVENILELDHIYAREIMTPRIKIIWIEANESHEQVWHKIVISGHSVFPVYEKTRDNVLGMISVKSIYANLAAQAPVNIRDLVTEALLIPENSPASKLMEQFKSEGKHQALLVDEFGHVVGLVTIHDLLETIVGEMPTMEDRMKPQAMRRKDGSWLVDAILDCEDLEEHIQGFTLGDPLEREYQTVAGYVIEKLGKVPEEGDTFIDQDYQIEIIDMDGHRVDKVLLIPTSNLLHKAKN